MTNEETVTQGGGEEPEPVKPCPEGEIDPEGYRYTVVNHCEWKTIHAAPEPAVEVVPVHGLAEVRVDNMQPFELRTAVICAGLVEIHGLQDNTCVKYKSID